MNESAKNALIGFFIIAASSLVIWMLLFLHPSVGDGKQKLHVRFSYINQVDVGTRVTYSGLPVGQVTHIKELPVNSMRDHVDTLGRIYVYELTLAIDSDVKVYSSDTIHLETSGLLGEKSIDITPRLPQKGQALVEVQPGAILYAQSVSSIESAFSQVEKVGKKVTVTLDFINNFFDKNNAVLTRGIAGIADTFEASGRLLKVAEKRGLMDQTANLVDNLTDITAAINDPVALHALVQNIATISQAFADGSGDITQTLANLSRLTDSGTLAMDNIAQITETIASGKGSIGKLIESDDFYLHVVSMMSKVDTLLNDVNHYGVLFHLNKGWQRTRMQRASTLESLNSPQEFKRYLNQEVDTVSTALARIELLLEKASDKGSKEKILKSDVFKRDFVQLMQSVQNLDGILKLYTEEITGQAQ
jgi:phospholipid/cholesterol/gamma-HCH transport system substrate-binding protein